ncbi:MAG: SMP-30/gluconolactonase/LRE family protein [Cytophagaceae bacterium]|nr:SMP-30/gluconolactonase/LRE family protein [Cytophagaceae bacterium]
MKNLLTIAALALSTLLLAPSLQAQTLTKKWESDTLLQVPESVLFDASTNSLYAACINGQPWGVDGNGYVAKLSPEGKITTLKWATGFDAPKGMGISGGKMYLADVTKIRVIDLKTGKLETTLEPQGAKQLNDVSAGPDGTVYVTDMGRSMILQVKNGQVSTFLEDKTLERPNGVRAVGKRMFVVDAGKGIFYEIMSDKSLRKIAEGMPSGDGIEPVGNDFLLSRWAGVINYCTADGKLTKLLDTEAQKINAADIGYDPKTRMVFVPTFFKNSVVAYELSK